MRTLLLSVLLLSSFAQAADRAPLALASVHAAVVELDSGDVLYEKHADRQVPVASITKLMTAMVVLDAGQPLNEWLKVHERATPPPRNAWSRIRIGSEARRRDLLWISLMSSENLAVYTLGRHFPGGTEGLIAAMNDKARELGMTQSRFVDASGLSADNLSSASDLARMLIAAHEYEEIRELSTRTYRRVGFRQPRYALEFGNTNRLVHSSRWNVSLSKTGYISEAGRCLTMVSEVDGRPVAMVFLDSLGRLSPIGDAGRVRRWLETGEPGQVAGAALAYERERSAAYQVSGQTELASSP